MLVNIYEKSKSFVGVTLKLINDSWDPENRYMFC